MNKSVKYYKEDLKQLKDEMGPVDDLVKTLNSERRKCITAISKVIKEKDVHTVPEIAAEIAFTTHEVHNAVNFMMKYYGLKFKNKRGDYPEYGFGGDQ